MIIRKFLRIRYLYIIFKIIHNYVGGQVCTDSVNIQQNGNTQTIGDEKLAIIPQFNFTCNGRITGIRARVRFDGEKEKYLFIQIWRPVSIGSMIYNKIGEVQLESDDQVTDSGNNRLAIIILTGNNTIEVQSGDVVGYYHPPDSRYRVRIRNTIGYIQYQFKKSPNLNSVNLSNADRTDNPGLPLIQFTIGKCELMLINLPVFQPLLVKRLF